MKVAPALAASRAWLAEKHSVTLTIVPSSVSVLQAFSPSTVSGTLTAILSAILASISASRIMPSWSVATTSAETGPSTMAQISAMTSRMLRPDLGISEGLVVTPSSRPVGEVADVGGVGGVDEEFHGGTPTISSCLAQARSSVALDQTKVGARSRLMIEDLPLARPRRCLVPMPRRTAYAYAVPVGMASGRGRSCPCRSDRARSPASSGTARRSRRSRKSWPDRQVFDARRSTAPCAVSSTGWRLHGRRRAWWRACCCARRRPSTRSPGARACS